MKKINLFLGMFCCLLATSVVAQNQDFILKTNSTVTSTLKINNTLVLPVYSKDAELRLTSNTLEQGNLIYNKDINQVVYYSDAFGSIKTEKKNIKYNIPGEYVFVVPDYTRNINIYITGAGGSGGGVSTLTTISNIFFLASSGNGGGAGGTAIKKNVKVSPGQVITIRVGKGGTYINALECNGIDGQDSYVNIGEKIIGAYGGKGGFASGVAQLESGGSAYGGNINLKGGDGLVAGSQVFYQTNTNTTVVLKLAHGGHSYWGSTLESSGRGGDGANVLNIESLSKSGQHGAVLIEYDALDTYNLAIVTGFSFLKSNNPSLVRDIYAKVTQNEIQIPFYDAGLLTANLTPTILFQGSASSIMDGQSLSVALATSCNITSLNGKTVKHYTVTSKFVKDASVYSKNILSFRFEKKINKGVIYDTYTATRNGKNLDIKLPFGTNLTRLSPTIVLAEGSIANMVTGQYYDFSNPNYTNTAFDTSSTVNCVVTGADASQAIYKINISYFDKNSNAKINSFSLPKNKNTTDLERLIMDLFGEISEPEFNGNIATITFKLPSGISVNAIYPTISITGRFDDFDPTERLNMATFTRCVVLSQDASKVIYYNIDLYSYGPRISKFRLNYEENNTIDKFPERGLRADIFQAQKKIKIYIPSPIYDANNFSYKVAIEHDGTTCSMEAGTLYNLKTTTQVTLSSLLADGISETKTVYDIELRRVETFTFDKMKTFVYVPSFARYSKYLLDNGNSVNGLSEAYCQFGQSFYPVLSFLLVGTGAPYITQYKNDAGQLVKTEWFTSIGQFPLFDDPWAWGSLGVQGKGLTQFLGVVNYAGTVSKAMPIYLVNNPGTPSVSVSTKTVSDETVIDWRTTYRNWGLTHSLIGGLTTGTTEDRAGCAYNYQRSFGLGIAGGGDTGDYYRAGGLKAAVEKNLATQYADVVHEIGKMIENVGTGNTAYKTVHVDWEFPMNKEDGKKLGILLKAFYESNQKGNVKICVPVAGDVERLSFNDWTAIKKYADIIEVMSYDNAGNWDSFTGHHSSLYNSAPYYISKGVKEDSNIADACSYIESQGIDRKKIYIGLAGYARLNKLKNPAAALAIFTDYTKPYFYSIPNGISSKDYNNAVDYADFDGLMGSLNYYRLVKEYDSSNKGKSALKYKKYMSVIEDTGNDEDSYWDTRNNSFMSSADFGNNGWKAYYDSQAEAPYMINAKKGVFMTYENRRSILAKVQYVKDTGLGGVLYWAYNNAAGTAILQDIMDAMKADHIWR